MKVPAVTGVRRPQSAHSRVRRMSARVQAGPPQAAERPADVPGMDGRRPPRPGRASRTPGGRSGGLLRIGRPWRGTQRQPSGAPAPSGHRIRIYLNERNKPFSKISILSGLNNRRHITLDPDYATVCGYTEADLDRTFGPDGAEAAMEQMRDRDCAGKHRGRRRPVHLVGIA